MKSSLFSCCPRTSRLQVRRKKVADAARTLFADRGFEPTPMTMIADAAGVKVGQIYRDFVNKEEIVADIVRSDLNEILDEETLERAIAAGDRAAIRGWVTGLTCCADPAEGRLFAQITVEATRNPGIAKLFHDADQRIAAALDRAIGALMPQADESDRSDLVHIVMALLTAVSQRRLAASAGGMGGLAPQFDALIGRELDRLAARYGAAVS